MNSHLLITNNQSFSVVQSQGAVGVFEEDKNAKLHLKTRADILADLSCIKKGDYIFFHNTDEKGIKGVYEVTHLPYFDYTDDGLFEKKAPYRFLVKPVEELYVENYLKEEVVFSFKDSSKKFESIFYKKVLNRGKACTHLLPEESEALIKCLLENKNGDTPPKPNFPKATTKQLITPEFIHKGSGPLQYEKELEWWLAYNIDKKDKCEIFLGKEPNIESFSNYRPLNIQEANLDFFVTHSHKVGNSSLRYRITVIELKKDYCDAWGLLEIENTPEWLVNCSLITTLTKFSQLL